MGNTLVVASYDGEIYSIDANTGEQKWNYKTDGFLEAFPAIADRKVLIGTKEGNFYAIGG